MNGESEVIAAGCESNIMDHIPQMGMPSDIAYQKLMKGTSVCSQRTGVHFVNVVNVQVQR